MDRIEAKLDRLLPKPFDEIASEWERLRARQEIDRRAAYEALQNIVRGLDGAEGDSSPSPVDPFELGAEPSAPRLRPQPQPEAVKLPQRRTHGGPFGPQVRAKLIEEALRRG